MPQNARQGLKKGLEACLANQKKAPIRILVALSGGADSVALLRLLLERAEKGELALAACHVNHGIRGEEADRDEAFCKELCRQLNIPFRAVRVDVPAYAKAQKKGLEESARELRYEQLSLCKSELGCDLIATAHHAEDHLETVLFHLARGCGTKGLLGIAPRRGDLIRPLLFCRKQDLLSYLSFLGQPFCFDSTNDDTELTRNYIRQTLIPGLLEINPSAPQACLAMSGILREDDRLLSSLVPEDFPEISILCTLPDPILARLLEREFQNAEGKGLEQVHLKALLRLVRQGKTGKRLSLPSGITALREKTRITFCRTAREKKTPKNGKETAILHTIDRGSSEGDHIVWIESGDAGENPQKIHNLSTKVKIRFDILSDGLYWRTRRPGDTIRMAGMTRKIRKLQWQSGKSPKERDEMPIVCDKNGPLWLPQIGLRDGAAPMQGQEWVWLCCKK